MKNKSDTMLIISRDWEAMETSLILGTGGWLPPDQRETLDWMTLGRIMGWRVKVLTPENFRVKINDEFNIKWLIFSGDPDSLGENIFQEIIETINHKPILFISRAGKTGGEFEKLTGIHLSENICTGNKINWNGTGNKISWICRNTIQLNTIETPADFDPIVIVDDKRESVFST